MCIIAKEGRQAQRARNGGCLGVLVLPPCFGGEPPSWRLLFTICASVTVPSSDALFFWHENPNCLDGTEGPLDWFVGAVLLGKTDCRCNRMDRDCGLTAAEAQLLYLTPYAEIPGKLQDIEDSFAFGDRASIEWGPLIENDGTGLINIDVPLSDNCDASRIDCGVCGTDNENPTVREAVVCTVRNDPLGFPARGNADPARVGLSTQGRPLHAIRMGNFGGGRRTLLLSQVHGNEPSGTEAFLKLAGLADGSHPHAASLLANLDMLFVVRVNVDGGEPTASTLEEDYADYYNGDKAFDEDAYFLRQNVDPRAGGDRGAVDGNAETESGFFG